MKLKMLLTTVAMGFAAVSFGQTSYGIKAGVNLPKLQAKGGSISYTTKTSTSFYVSAFMDSNIAPSLSIQPGISLQGKGGKVSSKDSGVNEEIKDDYMYVEIPVNLVYYISAGTGDVFLGAGPYAGFGVSAKTTMGSESKSGSFKEGNLNVFDAGLNFLAGYKLGNGFLINGGYSLGLANMDKNADGWSVKNRVFSLGVGFQF